MAETAMLRDPLNQFDVVPERVAKVESLETRNLRLLLDWQLRGLDFFPPRRDVVHLVRQVRPRRWPIHVLLHADVRLELARVEPEPLALEHRRPGDFLHPEEAEVKLARLGQL